jgi:SM-20-related protein
MITLRLNPDLDPATFAKVYAQTKTVQIPHLFEDETADALERVLLSLPWRLVCQNEYHETILLTQETLAAMSAEQRRKLEEGIRARAADNLGYTYYTYPMIEAAQRGWEPGHPIHALTVFLNSPSFLEFAKQITDEPVVTKVDAHASNYQRGHYLTRHIDDGKKKERRAAYTIGFSRNWQPDWGGLLLFLDEKMDVQSGLLPRFNTLTVFDGLRLHSVSAISTFAPAPRLSIAGWFRDDPINR